MTNSRKPQRGMLPVCVIAVTAAIALRTVPAWAANLKFSMVRSAALNAIPDCVPDATGSVSIKPGGPVETMDVKVKGLPPNTDFDFFVIQVPHSPFGMSWYQGDIETNKKGVGHVKFIGRFSIETFVVAPGSAPAPVTFNNAFPDASANPPGAIDFS